MKQKIIFTPSTREKEIVGNYPIPSVSLIPDWFKKIKRYGGDDTKIRLNMGTANSTVKSCSPFLDALSSGYMFTLDDDVLVSWENDYPVFKWRTDRTMITLKTG
jgi:hypothetical protein